MFFLGFSEGGPWDSLLIQIKSLRLAGQFLVQNGNLGAKMHSFGGQGKPCQYLCLHVDTIFLTFNFDYIVFCPLYCARIEYTSVVPVSSFYLTYDSVAFNLQPLYTFFLKNDCQLEISQNHHIGNYSCY